MTPDDPRDDRHLNAYALAVACGCVYGTVFFVGAELGWVPVSVVVPVAVATSLSYLNGRRDAR